MHYAELEQVNKICPLLSIAKIHLTGTVVYCLGEACQWYDKCSNEDKESDKRYYFDWQKKTTETSGK